MTIAILSDTHLPTEDASLPDEFVELVQDADHVIHAGDFATSAVVDEIDSMAAHLTAVYGNADPDDVDLPTVASLEVDGVTFVVVHGIVNVVRRAVGSSEGVVMELEDWYDAIADVARVRADEPRVGVGGHTHRVEDTVHDGVRLLNPGSAMGIDPASRATMMTAEIVDGEVDVTVHEA